MWLIVYIDIVFLVNFIISFSFLLLIKFILNGRESLKRIFLSSIISVLLLFAFFLNKFFFQLFKLSGGIIIVSFTFNKTDIIEKILRVILYYFMQFSLVGMANAFLIKTFTLLICLAFLTLSFLFFKYKKIVSKRNVFYKELVLYKDRRKIRIDAYLDSGNFSNFNGNAIIYLNSKYSYLSEGLIKKDYIVNTIDTYITIDIYYLEEVFVNGKKYKDVYISFKELNSLDCLLNVIMA